MWDVTLLSANAQKNLSPHQNGQYIKSCHRLCKPWAMEALHAAAAATPPQTTRGQQPWRGTKTHNRFRPTIIDERGQWQESHSGRRVLARCSPNCRARRKGRDTHRSLVQAPTRPQSSLGDPWLNSSRPTGYGGLLHV